MSQMNLRYFAVLDGIRGIAAFLVVFRHTSIFFGSFAFQQTYLAVDVFFVLSGFVLCSAYQHRLEDGLSSGRFAFLRLIRIYPLYCLGTMIGLVAMLVMDNPVSARTIIAAFLLLPSINFSHAGLFVLNGPAWTLSLELVVSLAYGAFAWKLSDRNVLRVLAGGAIGLLICLAIMPEHTLDLGWSVHTLPGGAFRLVFGFAAGMLLYRAFVALHPIVNGLVERNRYHNLLSWLLIGTVASILVANPAAHLRWLYDICAVSIAFPFLVFAAAYLRPNGWSYRLFKTAGAISFPLYALHEPVGRLIEGSAARFAHYHVEKHAPWIGFGLLVVMIALSWFLDKAYDRPVRHSITKIMQTTRLSVEQPMSATAKP